MADEKKSDDEAFTRYLAGKDVVAERLAKADRSIVPSRETDQRILAAGRAVVEEQKSRRRMLPGWSWELPVASLAVLVISVGIVSILIDQRGTIDPYGAGAPEAVYKPQAGVAAKAENRDAMKPAEPAPATAPTPPSAARVPRNNDSERFQPESTVPQAGVETGNLRDMRSSDGAGLLPEQQVEAFATPPASVRSRREAKAAAPAADAGELSGLLRDLSAYCAAGARDKAQALMTRISVEYPDFDVDAVAAELAQCLRIDGSATP